MKLSSTKIASTFVFAQNAEDKAKAETLRMNSLDCFLVTPKDKIKLMGKPPILAVAAKFLLA